MTQIKQIWWYVALSSETNPDCLHNHQTLQLVSALRIHYLPLCLMTADTFIDAGQQYWEVRFDKESKAFAVGIALRSLGRFDQLGKSGASWCIHLNNWLQQSLTAKHNNKARTLDCPIPNSIGVYVNYDEGTISTWSAPRWWAQDHCCFV